MKQLQYGKEYLNWWYNEGGAHDSIFGLDSLGGQKAVGDKIAKAIGPWDAPASPYSVYFEPVFSATVHMYTERWSEVLKLLPKTTFLAEGDSMKYWETDLAGLTGVTTTSTPFASGSAESAPTIASIEEVEPAYVVDPWETSLMSRTRATWQIDPKLNPQWIKRYHTENLPNQLDKMLTQTIDTPSSNATSYNIESLDRIISRSSEASTTYCSAATDPDLWWNTSAAKIDRSTDTDDTFGGGAGAGVDIGSGSERVLTLDMIDDALAEAVPYSRRRRYIAITGPKTLNEMQKLIDPKQRYLDVEMDVQYTMNGVQTREGRDTGFSVAAYISNGIKIPFFTSRHVANETSDNRSATVGTSNSIGNIYLVDLDNIELRVAIPITYLETPPHAMLTGDVMKTRHMFLYSAQLFGKIYRAHASVKYLKKS